jgi:hypothetical protein
MSSSSLDAMPHLKNALRSEEDVSLIGMESVGCESYVLSVDDRARPTTSLAVLAANNLLHLL